MSWRMLGGMIMAHGDDRGLRVPPKMAPFEAVFVPIVRSNDERAVSVCREAAAELARAGFRVRVDARDQQPGWKYSEWDLRGVPVRIEIGPRDVDAGSAVAGAARPRKRRCLRKSRPCGWRTRSRALRATARRHSALALRAGQGVLDRTHRPAAEPPGVLTQLCTERAGMIDIAVVRTCPNAKPA